MADGPTEKRATDNNTAMREGEKTQSNKLFFYGSIFGVYVQEEQL